MPIPVLGVDITSAPCTRKPLAAVMGYLTGARLTLAGVDAWTDWRDLARAVEAIPGGAVGLDAPFGVPDAFAAWSGWPGDGCGRLERIAALSRGDFGRHILAYRETLPTGDSLPTRETDRRCGAVSPLRWAYVPVARMLHAVAPCLLGMAARVAPFSREPGAGAVMEVYPALTGKRLTRESYRTRTAADRASRARLRGDLLDRLTAGEGTVLRVTVSEGLREAVRLDPEADVLDAVFAAVQTAEAVWQGCPGINHPQAASEGWIVSTPPRA